MERVPEWVEQGRVVVTDRVRDVNDVRRRDGDVFRERAVPVDADDLRVPAHMRLPRTAELAVAADDVSFGGDPVPGLDVLDETARLDDLSHELVSEDERRIHAVLRPVVPLMDVEIRAADARASHLDQDLAGTDLGEGHVAQGEAGRRLGLEDRFHGDGRRLLPGGWVGRRTMCRNGGPGGKITRHIGGVRPGAGEPGATEFRTMRRWQIPNLGGSRIRQCVRQRQARVGGGPRGGAECWRPRFSTRCSSSPGSVRCRSLPALSRAGRIRISPRAAEDCARCACPCPVAPRSPRLPGPCSRSDVPEVEIQETEANRIVADLLPVGVPAPSAGRGEGAGQGDDGEGGGVDGGYIAPVPRSVVPHWDPPGSVRGMEVTVRIFVDATGRPGLVELLPPTPDEGFNRDIIRQVRGWEYRPALRDGDPVDGWAEITFIF